MLFMRTYADHSWGIEKGFGGSLWVMDDFHGQMHEVTTPKRQCHRISRGSFPASRDQKGHVYHQIWLVLHGLSVCGPRSAAGTFRGDDKRLWDLKKSDTVFEALSEWIYEPSLDHLPVPGELSMVASFNSIIGRHECWIHLVISWSAVFVGSGLDTLNVPLACIWEVIIQ